MRGNKNNDLKRQPRIFLAIRIPDRLKKELGKVQRYLGEHCEALRFLKPDQLHITLAFLGRISEESLLITIAICQDIAQRSAAFSVFPSQLGAFPRLKRPSVIWVGLGGDTDQLEQMTYALGSQLFFHHILPIRGAGGFSAHITLARVDRKRKRHSLFAIRSLLEDTTLDLSDFTIPVTEIMVYQSNLGSAGPQHIPLKAIPLGR